MLLLFQIKITWSNKHIVDEYYYFIINQQTQVSMDAFQSGITARQLEREFDLVQFTNVVNSLLNSLDLTTRLSIKNIYQSVRQKNTKVIGKDVLQVLNIIQQSAINEKKIDQQIEIYRNKIEQIRKKGRSSLSIGQFYIHFVLGNNKKGIVTHEIQMKLSTKKSIAIESLADLITSIKQARKQIPYYKLKNQNQAIRQRQSGESLDSQNAKTNFEGIQKLRKFIIQNIYSEDALKNGQFILQQIQQIIQQGYQNTKKLEQVSNIFTKNQENLYGQIFKLERIIQYKDIAIAKLTLYSQRLESDIKMAQNKNEREIAKVLQQNLELKRKNESLKQKKTDLETRLQQLKNQHRMGIELNIEKILQMQTQLQKKQIKSIQQVLKSNLEKQLQEAYQNINKLSIENQQLLVRVSDLQIELDAVSINAHIAGSMQIINKPFILSQTLTASLKNEEDKCDYFRSFRKNSNLINDENDIVFSISEQKTKSMKMIRSLTKQHLQVENNSQQMLDIARPNSTSQLLYFDYFGILQSKYFKQITNFIVDLQRDECQTSSLFSCPAQLINSSYSNLIKGMIFSTDKILLLTSQMQISITIDMHEVDCIYFCMDNRDLIVIKMKQQRSRESCIKQDYFIIRLYRREQIIQYLIKYAISNANHLQLTFQKQQNIVITHRNKSITITDILKPYKSLVSLLSGEKFEIKLKEATFLGLFGISTNFTLVVCQLGVILFQNDQKNYNPKSLYKQRLKKVLPFLSSMEIIQLSGEHKLKIIYPDFSESYTIQLISYGETKLLHKKIMKYILNIKSHSNMEMNKYRGIMMSLLKMRTQLNQNLITTETNQ